MTEQDIAALVAERGFKVRSNEFVSRKGNGESSVQLSMARSGIKAPIYIGVLHRLVKMSEAEIVVLIEAKIARMST